jgi:hypothetical protein
LISIASGTSEPQWKDVDREAKTLTFAKGILERAVAGFNQNRHEHVRHMSRSLERLLADHLQLSAEPNVRAGLRGRSTWTRFANTIICDAADTKTDTVLCYSFPNRVYQTINLE